MGKHKYLPLMLFSFVCAIASASKTGIYTIEGRTEITNDQIILIGSASWVGFKFNGNSCSLSLQAIDTWDHYNFIVFELDGKYLRRQRIESIAANYIVTATAGIHTLKIFKATEAANGNVAFSSATAEKLLPMDLVTSKKIEFIGDSITCGMGNDLEIPCNTGQWFDQHNAYFSYGPVTARGLQARMLLSSVSGYGIYRNWNDEHTEQPVLPDVYDNLYLNLDASKKYNSTFNPDIVTICLGTNDLSEGDKIKPRLPFDAAKFTKAYIAFIHTVYKQSPQTRIVLMNSPMVSGDRNTLLVKCLKEVAAAFANDTQHKPISIFEFKPMQPNGCGFHPDIADDKIMADQLHPYLKKLLDEK
ncbi:acetylxylan esterase [Flavobacterium noncentrifugens]|uniref:Lysophospholipase L1 n=1 Tax=Flavobacterium noncentrifugens TaxID=1128970 RepID=A0A1G8WFZ6_9FLAO|nr:SGNH/GDSL hydrolase family protein [Flavobacterium noncentrifugens]GEP50913.1 acetylxylan esterase [Flavobacterium noncentrifugens]SDJ77131.1 Lysophospholipase L1 [Flavobacterium noncentrifugens]